MGEDENMAPSSTFLSATMAFPSSSSYPSSTAFPTSTAAAQLSAENEDDDKVDFVCQTKVRVEIPSLVVEWLTSYLELNLGRLQTKILL